MANSNMIFRGNSYAVKFKVSVVEWQHKNEASVHRPAKEFADDRSQVCPRVVSMLLAHWKDKPAECLENAAVYTVAYLCHAILTIEFLEDKKSEGKSLLNQLLYNSL